MRWGSLLVIRVLAEVQLLGMIGFPATDLTRRILKLHDWRIKEAAVVRNHRHTHRLAAFELLKGVMGSQGFFPVDLETVPFEVLSSDIAEDQTR